MTPVWSDSAARLTSWFQRKTFPSAVRRIAAFPAALASDVGLKRDENQDRVAIGRGTCGQNQPYVLAALSDGIGGMKDGAACAATTLGTLFACFFELARPGEPPERTLEAAVRAANSTIFSKLSGKGGATLSALLLCEGIAYTVNVGDSRIYKYSNGQLTQLTVDDTIAGQLGHKVEADMGSNLLQFVGIGNPLEVNVTQLPFAHEDALLLTSDGVHYLDQSWIATLIANSSDPGTALRRLTETAKWCGGHDNASAAFVLPQLTLQELADGDDDHDATCGIWDPFGELHLLLNRARPGQSSAPVQPVESNRSDREVGRSTPAPEPAFTDVQKAPRSKRKREKKAKAPAQRSIEEPLEPGQDKPKAPQLKIEFPQKAD
ncbi:PP2C family protein-serine/threonine phosphatase [Caldimonas sp. KR1-144]|uniref:PP2C family protein-serine/threonine phosphatase n=1 Tax=Caldimonas sp. KR1-144 TaxID=3400911 RepID=UPI003C082474